MMRLLDRMIFQDIVPKIKSFGSHGCEIDSEGFVSGKLNRDVQT
jgi:hypothetical protein